MLINRLPHSIREMTFRVSADTSSHYEMEFKPVTESLPTSAFCVLHNMVATPFPQHILQHDSPGHFFMLKFTMYGGHCGSFLLLDVLLPRLRKLEMIICPTNSSCFTSVPNIVMVPVLFTNKFRL